ncbi:AAA family ATPase [Pseudomonas purpurea]|uniref:AAA family ATPase n=1 Tax=Pseudomonas purpurea TaxID=3136737 RepID=UPI00326722CA
MGFKQLSALVPKPGGETSWPELMEVIPAIKLLAGTPQEPEYHGEGNVLIHTKMVVEAMICSSPYIAATDEQRFVLFYACVLHDISKPSTTVIDPVTGRIGQPGHSARGAVDARLILWRAGVPFETRETICRIIRVHQLPFFALRGNRAGQSAEFIIHSLSWQLPIWMLCAVATADMAGRQYAGKQSILEDIEIFKLLAEDEGCLATPKTFVDAHTRLAYFQGANVLPDFPLYKERTGSQVIVMCGMPACGKNTWVEKHANNLPVVSFDDARTELGLAHGKDEGRVAGAALAKAKDLLRGERAFVWNATHLSTQMRKKTLDLLHAYHADVRLVYLEQTEKEIFLRNDQRDTSLTNKKITTMLYKWEVPTAIEAGTVEFFV